MAEPLSKVDISAIAGYGGKFEKKLIGDYYLGSDIATTMSTRGGLNAPSTLTKLTLSEGLRKLNTNITTAKGGRTYTPRTITPRASMKIWSVIPDDLLDTWMSEMQVVGATKESFASWIWRKEREKLAEEYLLNFYHNKFADAVAYDPADAYAAGVDVLFNDIQYRSLTNAAAGESPTTHAAKWEDVDARSILDGPGSIIAAEITDGKLAPVILGALDNGNTLAGFQELYGQQPRAVKESGKLIINCSFESYGNYQEDYNNRHGSGKGIGGADLDGKGLISLKGSADMCKIQPCKWMGGSDRLIITPKNNMVYGYSKDVAQANIKTIQTLHGYDTVAKFMTGFQFNDLSLLGVNDQV